MICPLVRITAHRDRQPALVLARLETYLDDTARDDDERVDPQTYRERLAYPSHYPTFR